VNVSLVIPSYNAESTIGGLLESIRALDPAPLEVIVVDDCSTDSTVQIVSGFEDVTCLATPANSGPSAARNLGARTARGELLLFIDSDCVMLTTDCIDRHVHIHRQHPRCLLTGAVQSMTSESITGRAAAYYEWHEMIPRHAHKALEPTTRMGSAHFSISKSDFEIIGGFDETIRAGEDTVFHHDALQNGFEPLIANDIVVGHFDVTDVRLRLKKLFHYGKARVLIKRRGVYGKYARLMPDNIFLAALTWPVISAWLTLRIVLHWLPHSRKVLLYVPFLLLYSLAFALGPVAFLWEERRVVSKPA